MSLRIPTAGATGSSSPGVDCTVTRYCYPVPLPCTVTLYYYPALLSRPEMCRQASPGGISVSSRRSSGHTGISRVSPRSLRPFILPRSPTQRCSVLDLPPAFSDLFRRKVHLLHLRSAFPRLFPREHAPSCTLERFSPAFPARTCAVLYLGAVFSGFSRANMRRPVPWSGFVCAVLYLGAAFPGISRLTVHLPAPSDGLESEEGTRKGFKRVFLQTLGRSKEHEKVLSAPSSYPHSLEW